MGFSQRLNGGGEEGGGGAEREGRELNDKQERPCTMPVGCVGSGEGRPSF